MRSQRESVRVFLSIAAPLVLAIVILSAVQPRPAPRPVVYEAHRHARSQVAIAAHGHILVAPVGEWTAPLARCLELCAELRRLVRETGR